MFGRSPPAVRPQSFAVSMLWPREVTGRLQLDPVSAIPWERIVFLSVVVPPPMVPRLPPFPFSPPALPPASVSFVSASEPSPDAVIVPPMASPLFEPVPATPPARLPSKVLFTALAVELAESELK